MSTRFHVLLGVGLGLAVSAAVLSLHDGGRGRAGSASGPLLSECDGALRRLVIQYADGADDVVMPTYRELPPPVAGRRRGLRRVSQRGRVSRPGSRGRADRVPPDARDRRPPHHVLVRDRWLALGPAPGSRRRCCTRARRTGRRSGRRARATSASPTTWRRRLRRTCAPGSATCISTAATSMPTAKPPSSARTSCCETSSAPSRRGTN